MAAGAQLWRIVGGYTPQSRVIRHSYGRSEGKPTDFLAMLENDWGEPPGTRTPGSGPGAQASAAIANHAGSTPLAKIG